MIRFFGPLMLVANVLMANGVYAQSATTTEKEKETPATALSSEKDVTYLICKNRASVRTLRVQTRNNGSCFTTYTKEGVDQVVSSSKESQTCLKVLSNIRENLEKGSWKCKDISEARVSSSLE